MQCLTTVTKHMFLACVTYQITPVASYISFYIHVLYLRTMSSLPVRTSTITAELCTFFCTEYQIAWRFIIVTVTVVVTKDTRLSYIETQNITYIVSWNTYHAQTQTLSSVSRYEESTVLYYSRIFAHNPHNSAS